MVNPEVAAITLPAVENNVLNHNDYEVCEGYDETFRESAAPITLRELERLQDPPPETSADPQAIADFNNEKLKRRNAEKDGFLFALLLKIKPKISDDHHLPYQNSRFGLKKQVV